MKRALASVVGGALAVVPATAGVAAVSPARDTFDIPANPLTVAQTAIDPLHEEVREGDARAALQRATRRAERKRAAERRRERRSRRRAEARPVPVSPALQAIAACESGGDPRAIGGGGAFRGKYQFTRQTWAGVGGTGDPAAAPEAEQDRRAAILYSRSGPAPWPVCGR